MALDRHSQLESARRCAAREGGDISVQITPCPDGVEIEALYRGAHGFAMTASQMVTWKIIDEGTPDAIRIVLAQILESMRLDIRRLTSQPQKKPGTQQA
jgi:hypothetical protein